MPPGNHLERRKKATKVVAVSNICKNCRTHTGIDRIKIKSQYQSNLADIQVSLSISVWPSAGDDDNDDEDDGDDVGDDGDDEGDDDDDDLQQEMMRAQFPRIPTVATIPYIT